MTNRFAKKRKNPLSGFILLLPILAFICIFILFNQGVSSVNETTLMKQQESLETAIYRSVTQCYVVEGAYPPSLTYLEDHYGLMYDNDLFFIDYQPVGANIMPDITIIRKK